MSQNNSKKPILVREEAGVQTFRDPVTGEEFSTTVSKPISGIERDSRLAKVKCMIFVDREIAPQITKVLSAAGPDRVLNCRQIIAEARTSGLVTIGGLRLWRAEEIAATLREDGFSVDVVRE